LPDQKERLDCPDLTPFIFEQDKKVIESLIQGGADQLVKTVVLASVAEGFAPGGAMLQILLTNDRSKAARNPDGATE
jgi:hypothetical protein